VIDYNSADVAAEVMRLTGDAGVHCAYDSVGQDTMATSLAVTRRHGTIVNFGQASGPYTDFKIGDLAVGSLHLTRPSLFHFVADGEWLQAACADLFALVMDGTLDVSINQTFALEDVAAAHTALAARQTTGCTVLTP
jgi:NADPH2:quinone reductase